MLGQPVGDFVMAARTFEIHFENQSGFALRRRDHGTSHGIWTNEPPVDIAPGATVSWQSESHGILTGTEARVVYQILDRNVSGALLGNNAPCLTLSWVNPYIGSPDAHHSIAPCPDLLLSDNHGDRQTYGLQVSASQGGEEKWTEWLAAGLVTGPFQLFHSSHPNLWVRLARGKISKVAQGLSVDVPNEPLSISGVRGGPIGAWSGSWAEGNPGAISNRVDVSVDGGDIATARFDVAVMDERTPSAGVFNRVGPVSYPHLPSYRGDFRQPADHIDIVKVERPKVSVAIGGLGGVKPNVIVGRQVRIPIEILGNVDTIRLDDHHSLQLFQESHGDRVTGYRVRYFRTDGNGHTMLDLMLHPISVIK